MRRTGAKGRHNKVCTSKGTRERRIRLSANTAIQFYDVQDRLGYDRASKAIDWLMKEAKVAIDALNADHHDDHQEYRLPATTTRSDPSEAFHPTPCDENEPLTNHRQIGSFDNHPLEFMNSINRCQTEQESNVFSASTSPLDFTWNPNYDTGEGFASVGREPLQSSFPRPIAHTSNNAFDNDNGLLAFSFEQETQVQEDEKDILVPRHYLSSDTTSGLHYQD